MKPYSPSNASEGIWFEDNFCQKCARETWDTLSDKGRKCSILNKIILGDQPKEWQYGEDEKPTCTAFKLPIPRKKSFSRKTEQMTF